MHTMSALAETFCRKISVDSDSITGFALQTKIQHFITQRYILLKNLHAFEKNNAHLIYFDHACSSTAGDLYNKD